MKAVGQVTAHRGPKNGQPGETGPSGAQLFCRGEYDANTTYVWNDEIRDYVWRTVSGTRYYFAVKTKGSSFSGHQPTPLTTDTYWKSASQLGFLAVGAITAEMIDVNSLVTSDAFINSLVAKYIKTATTGERVVINEDDDCSLHIYNASNKKVVSIVPDAISSLSSIDALSDVSFNSIIYPIMSTHYCASSSGQSYSYSLKRVSIGSLSSGDRIKINRLAFSFTVPKISSTTIQFVNAKVRASLLCGDNIIDSSMTYAQCLGSVSSDNNCSGSTGTGATRSAPYSGTYYLEFYLDVAFQGASGNINSFTVAFDHSYNTIRQNMTILGKDGLVAYIGGNSYIYASDSEGVVIRVCNMGFKFNNKSRYPQIMILGAWYEMKASGGAMSLTSV